MGWHPQAGLLLPWGKLRYGKGRGETYLSKQRCGGVWTGCLGCHRWWREVGITRVPLACVGGGVKQQRDTFGLPWTGEDASAAGLERKMGLVMFPK